MAHLALSNLVLEVTDVERSARFWSAALGYVEFARPPGGSVALQHPTDARRPALGLVPAEHSVPRAFWTHFDLETDDRAGEVARLEKLGATREPDWPYPMPEPNWTVMRDPDGHVFCVSQRPVARRRYG